MMRHSAERTLITLLVTLCSAQAFGTPVYLKLESRFPSGHYTRQTLENRTRKVQFQRWHRVEAKDKAIGWLPEEFTLTALRLSTEATLIEPVPHRTEPLMDSVTQEVFAKGTRVYLSEQQGSWIKARVVSAAGTSRDTWIPSESLKPVLTSPTQKAFIPKMTPAYVLPGLNARVNYQVRTGAIVSVIRENAGWLEIRTAQGSGFIHRMNVITASDLGEKGARPLVNAVPLRSAPLPYADVSRHLGSGAVLKIIQTQIVRWGQAKLSDLGEVWWPIVEEAEEKDLAPREKLTTPELFKRKIFDMASSPAIPQMKFASAQGVFRTIDGTEWTKIPKFDTKDYPIAIAGGGNVFIGPYVSDDHGETFEQWIRYDTLVATVRRILRSAPATLQIQEIKPEDPAGRRVVLKVGVGSGKSLKVVTDDQGVTWR